MKPTIHSLLFVFVLFMAGCQPSQKPVVYDLRVEGLVNPLGIDKATPRFSWKTRSTRNGAEQLAYQVLVAFDRKDLNDGKADLWDSGKVESASSLFVTYRGEPIAPGSVAWWKVRVWDEAGMASRWSEPARLGIGLLGEADWQAAFIAFPTDKGDQECPQLYSAFDVDDLSGTWLLHVNSLGYHEVYINGARVGDGVLAPAVSQFDRRSLVLTYDISGMLKKGANECMIWLGSGWYTEGLPGVANRGPVVRAQIDKLSKGQRETRLATGASFSGRPSGYTRHGNWRPNRFGGEIVDGSLSASDMDMQAPGRPWSPVTLVEIPTHKATPQMTEENILSGLVVPVSIEETGKDTFLVDMGKNLTGWIEVQLSKLEGSPVVQFDYADHLREGNRFNDLGQYDRYIATGDPWGVFRNRFNYHGFRYIRITGLSEKPDPGSIRAWLVRTGYDEASTFECSDPDLNAIHDMLQYTLQCLSLGGDLVDCPQIERLGYGGDGNASTLTAQTMFNLGPLYNNWLQAWSDVIRDDGGMPHTAPNPYQAGGGPYWCGFIITASWNTFLNYGDTLVLERYYPVMQQWLGYVDLHMEDGLLKRWPDTGYRSWYLGDWATPVGIDQTHPESVDLVNNSFVAVCFDNMERIARVLGKPGEAAAYAARKVQIGEKINEAFYHGETGTYATGTQVDLAFPMIAGVVPADRLEAVEAALMHETAVNRKGHLATGLVGLPVLAEWAVKNQAADYMYGMLKKRDYPGYLYMVDQGATTTWEHWNGARSHIHNCYNGIGSWFYQAVGGIQPVENEAASRRIRIAPQVPEGVTWANTTRDTPYGKVVVNWKLTNGMMALDIDIPVGTEAEVALPAGTREYFINQVRSVPDGASPGSIFVKSGKYRVEYAVL